MSDIDIEEHDVLQNPILREIFPDLSLLKKEIIDFNEDKTELNGEDSNNIAILQLEQSIQSTKITCYSYENKQILGYPKNVTVVLDNITTFLTRSQRFCSYCHILFPDISSFNNHQVIFHKGLACSFNNINNIKLKNCEILLNDIKCINSARNTGVVHNNETKKESLNSPYRSCVHCDLLFPSKKTLIEHLYKVLYTKKNGNTYKNLDTPYKLKMVSDLKKNRINKKLDTVLNAYDRDFYFCNTCKCYIPRASRVVTHLQSMCKNFIKCMCELCGLTLPKKSISVHKKNHLKHTHFNLQDFSFYDLKTKIKIKPCQVLPKCNICEIYFIHKSEIGNHICFKEENLECPVCCIKLSAKSYKVHLPFHNYILKGNDNILSNNITEYETISPNLENHVYIDTMGAERENLNVSTDNELNSITVATIYTCKNCDISFNEYDEVINHCQLHKNLNDLGLDSVKCILCNLMFLSSSYKVHQDLHSIYTKDQFKQFICDVHYFGSTNDYWLKYLFGNLSKNSIYKYIRKSIFKDECRIKLDIIQEGPVHLTMYKCSKCDIFIDAVSIYQHVVECCMNVKKIFCKFCKSPFINELSLNKHESVHSNANISSKSYRIVVFNKKEHKNINIQIANTKKYYILYQCRFCHVLIDYSTYERHECYTCVSKKCSKCGLLIQDSEYNYHTTKHINLDSFNKSLLYVILIGKDISQIINNNRSGIVPTFSGMISDYTFYKCAKCEVCVRDHRSSLEHQCLVTAAKLECPKCDLLFDKGKFKGHLRLHDNDPYFTKDTIMIKIFGISDVMTSSANDQTNSSKLMLNNDHNKVILETVKLYKCICGLHFLNKVTVTEHAKRCRGKIKLKQSKQNCLKCGLTFSHDVLFKHILKHHKGKNTEFKYKIIKI